MPNQRLSSPFPSCFRPSSTTTITSSPSPSPSPSTSTVVQPPISGNPTLTTSLYHTEFGLFGLTWCRNLLGRSFHLHLLFDNSAHLSFSPDTSTPSFQLQIKPFTFWKKRGSKKLIDDNTGKIAHVYWDLSRAKFGSRPEPLSGYYVTVVIDGETALLAGDSPKEANYASTKATVPAEENQVMVLQREHVYGYKSDLVYTTKATFGGKERDVSIDCRLGDGDDPKLYFSIDNKRVLQIKHLKWKFRGNERIEVDGIPVQVSWDVYRWLFEDHRDHHDDGYALFMFRFEKLGLEDELLDDYDRNGIWLWSQSQQTFGFPVGMEKKKMKKGLLRSGRSSSSSSLSSASSSCSSVMEWASTEENELKGPAGFSLVVYAWKS